MLLAWNAGSPIVKQNGCKNKTTWLTQTALSKSFSLFHTAYIADIKEFYFFVQNLFYVKRFRNEIFKTCEIKDCEWLENRITCGIKNRE